MTAPAAAAATVTEVPVREPGMRRLADVVDHLVDPRVGIIESLTEVRKEAGSPDFHHFAALAADTAQLGGLANFRNGSAAGATPERAAAKAIGEAVERYCSALYDITALPLATWRDAHFDGVHPREFALYSPQQYASPGFPLVPFTEDTPVRWARMTDLADGRTVRVPACRVHMPYLYLAGTGDSTIEQPISTGLACHLSPAEATVGAICEVVERDAVTLTWQAMLAPPRIRVETLPDDLYELVRRFERAASRVTLFDITLDHGIPTVLSTARAEHPGGPALVVAAATAPHPRDAARKSLEELAHSQRYAQVLASHMPRITPDPPHYESVTGQREHMNFWVDHRNLPHADFLFTSRTRIGFDEIADRGTGTPEGDVRMLVDRVTGVGERVLLADLTTPDAAALGFSVVRAVIPGFHPLHLGHRLRALGGDRLWSVPGRLGYPGRTPEQGDNPVPHPYP